MNLHVILSETPGGGGGGKYSHKFGIGVCCPGS